VDANYIEAQELFSARLLTFWILISDLGHTLRRPICSVLSQHRDMSILNYIGILRLYIRWLHGGHGLIAWARTCLSLIT
jgi:hypothetical protein